MKLLMIATVVAMIALLPGYSHAMASNHGRRGAGASAGPTAQNAGPDAAAPVSVPEPGSLLLVATGLSAVGGLLARKWYVTKKQAKRPEQAEL
jgi:hypothetical protein